MNLKRLVEVSPLIGSFLIFMGFLKLYYFYGHWNINIISYLDFSEIVLSFLNDLNILIFFLLLLIFQAILGIGTVVAIDNHIAKKQNQKPLIIQENGEVATTRKAPAHNAFRGIMHQIDEVYENHPRRVIIIILLFMFLFIILFLCLNHLIFLYLSFVCFIQLIPYFLEKIIGIKEDKILLQISFIITFVCFTFGIGRYEIKEIELNSKKVEIYMDKETFSTNDTIIFLGKTNNFYFFYNNNKKQSIIYPSSSVQKITQTP